MKKLYLSEKISNAVIIIISIGIGLWIIRVIIGFDIPEIFFVMDILANMYILYLIFHKNEELNIDQIAIFEYLEEIKKNNDRLKNIE